MLPLWLFGAAEQAERRPEARQTDQEGFKRNRPMTTFKLISARFFGTAKGPESSL